MKQLILGLFCVLLLQTSCVEEDTFVEKGKTNDSVQVTFSVDMPEGASLSTRAMDGTAENKIEELDILVFRQDNDNPEEGYFTDRIKVTSTISNGNTEREKNFTVSVGIRTYKQVFVLIANAGEQINQLTPAGQKKTEILPSLVYTHAGQWDATSSSQFMPIPMWGESEAKTITEATTSVTGISLHRMLARIDVRLSTDVAKSRFDLKKVFLYNRKTRGCVVPINNPTYWDASEKKALQATVPADDDLSNPLTVKGPLEYSTMTTADEAIEGEIYTFEAQASQVATEATCLVIGGIYAGDNDLSYYRVDFLDKAPEPDVRRDILRNHKYIVNITKVLAPGRASAEDAFNSTPVNMEVEIVDWLDSSTDAVFDGEHYLKVSKNPIALSGDAALGHKIVISTDCPGGWTANVPDAADNWITLQPGTTMGGPNQDTNLLFDVTSNLNNVISRTGRIQVKAGNFTKMITVTQSNATELQLEIRQNGQAVDGLVFASKDPSAETLQVSWTPASATCTVSELPTKNGGVSLLTSLSNPSNGVDFNLLAKTMPAGGDPFMEKESIITFTITDDTGRKQAKSVVLTQIKYSLVAITSDKYLMDGKEKSFTIKTNLDWKAQVTTDPKNAIKSLTNTTGRANTTVHDFKFTFKDDIYVTPTIKGATAMIAFSPISDGDPKKKFHDADDAIVQVTGFSGYRFEYNGGNYITAFENASSSNKVNWNTASTACNQNENWYLPNMGQLQAAMNYPNNFMNGGYWSTSEGGGGHYFVEWPSMSGELGLFSDYGVSKWVRCIYGPLP